MLACPIIRVPNERVFEVPGATQTPHPKNRGGGGVVRDH